MHFDHIPLHTVSKSVEIPMGQDPQTGQAMNQSIDVSYVLTTKGDYREFSYVDPNTNETVNTADIKHETFLYDKQTDLKVAEGYKDLHSIVFAFFGQDKPGVPTNSLALIATILYVLSMAVLGFHLWHGFSASFQSLGLRHKRYTPLIDITGKIFSVIVPLAFAVIPVIIYLRLV